MTASALSAACSKKYKTLLWKLCSGVQNLTERGNVFTLPLSETSVAMEKYTVKNSVLNLDF